MFQVAQVSARQAQQYLAKLLKQREACPSCVHEPFTAVILDFFVEQGANEEAACLVQAALHDAALSATGSSQSVEKMHSHVQVAQNSLANSGRRPMTVQRESYILAARIAHSRLKGLIEQEVFGKHGLARARKLMGSRVVSHTKAASSSLRDFAATASSGSVRKRRQYVRQHVLKIGQKKRVQTKANPWHAFLALQAGQKLRDDTAGMKERYRQWLSNPLQRQELLDKAEAMASERSLLAGNTLNTNVDTLALSDGQKKRMGQVQLDQSLRALVQHPAWRQGLDVHDSNSALAAKHVLGERDISVEECHRETDKIFHFDSDIAANPAEMPTIFRTCAEMHGGLCSQQPGCAEVRSNPQAVVVAVVIQ